MLQANTEPYWNGLIQTRKKAIEMRNGLRILLVRFQFFPKWTVVSWNVPLNEKLWILLYESYLIWWFLINFPILNLLWSFVYSDIYFVGAGMSSFMSISDGLSPYIFHQKIEKTGPKREKIGWKGVFSLQSRHFLSIFNKFKVFLPTCSLIWRVYNYVSAKEKV